MILDVLLSERAVTARLFSESFKACGLARNVSVFSEARFHEDLEEGAMLCARSIKPFEGTDGDIRKVIRDDLSG